jgi:hypothetical protein
MTGRKRPPPNTQPLKPLLVAEPNANRRILPQYVLRRAAACLVDLTPIPFGQRTKAWRTDWANFHLLRDPGSRYPNVRVALASILRHLHLVILWPRERTGRHGRHQ